MIIPENRPHYKIIGDDEITKNLNRLIEENIDHGGRIPNEIAMQVLQEMQARDHREFLKQKMDTRDDMGIEYPQEYEREERNIDFYKQRTRDLETYVQNLKNELFDARAGQEIITKQHKRIEELTNTIHLLKEECKAWEKKHNEMVDERDLGLMNKQRQEGDAVTAAIAQYKQLVGTYKKLYQDTLAELDKKS
jgi:hypothetical protein